MQLPFVFDLVWILIFGIYFHQIAGIISVGIVAYYYTNEYNYGFHRHSDLFFFLMATTFLTCTFCLLLSCVVSWSTGGLISKTMFVRSVDRHAFRNRTENLRLSSSFFQSGTYLSCRCNDFVVSFVGIFTHRSDQPSKTVQRP